MEETIVALRASIPGFKSTLKVASAKLQTLRAAPTTSDLANMVEKSRESNAEKAARVQAFREQGVQAISEEEMQAVEKEHSFWRAKMAARKKAFDNLVAALMEGMTKEQIWDLAGLEVET